MKVFKKRSSSGIAKILTLVFIAAVFTFFTGVECSAAENDAYTATQESIDGILEDFENALPDGIEGIDDINGAAEAVGIKKILNGIFNTVKGKSGELSAFLLLLLGIGMLGALASFANTELGRFSSRAVCIVSSALLFDRLASLVVGTVRSLEEIGDFFETVIPISLAVNSLGTSPTTATTQAVGMGLTLGIYSYFAKSIVLPVVCVIFVTSAASAVDPVFSGISKGVKGIFLWILGVLTALVGATFSLQSVIAASADSAMIRSAKYAISGSIPIVGNAVSGALGVIAGGVSYARGMIGGGAIAVIIALVLSPLITLLLYRFCLKMGIFFSSACSLDGCAGVMTSFLGAFDALIATYALTCVIYIVEMVAFMKGGASFA